MPIQAPQWTEYLKCPVCCREFALPHQVPISLSCGHSLCKICITRLLNRKCPFDQSRIPGDLDAMCVNSALLVLCGVKSLGVGPVLQSPGFENDEERVAYQIAVRHMEELASLLRQSSGGGSSGGTRLSRPMQRKLVTLVQCAIYLAEGRVRAAKAARALGERTLTEIILQHQNPGQLSAGLWAAVRSRGCQFLGPAMQEEVLRLILLALEDGSALSRKVLVMFVVQRLEDHFPQASKTSVGHVVQLLYRASCFKVSKRESDSSLMQLKEEFRTYDALRREHDAQIVQIATEAGLRIAPDQWSALLYGDAAHKSHMQSIIDKLSHNASYAQCVREAAVYVQRAGGVHAATDTIRRLENLAAIDTNNPPTSAQLADILDDVRGVIGALLRYMRPRHSSNTSTPVAGSSASVNYNPPEESDRCALDPRMTVSPYIPHPVLQIMVQPEYDPVYTMSMRWSPPGPANLPPPVPGPVMLPPPVPQYRMDLTDVCDPHAMSSLCRQPPVPLPSLYLTHEPLYSHEEYTGHHISTASDFIQPAAVSLTDTFMLNDTSRIDEEQLEEEILALEKRLDQEL